MRLAVVQMTASDDPEENLAWLAEAVARAAKDGADIVLTPEVTNCVTLDRAHQAAILRQESDDAFLAGARDLAQRHAVWILLGSLALRAEPPETRFVNRSALIDSQGQITARYDKMHMFDVQVSAEETYRESRNFAPGDRAVVARAAGAMLGLTVCYDLRFPALYRALAQAGAQVLTIPSAFSPGTGPAHWQPLLQARAIETGCFVVAPAQTGIHPARHGRSRKTHGHAMVVSPWGEVLLDAGTQTGVFPLDIDLAAVEDARRKVPSLQHDRAFVGPA